MIPINNSDTAWLITADFNQDNNLPYLDLIEDINNPEIDKWSIENRNDLVIFNACLKDGPFIIPIRIQQGGRVGTPEHTMAVYHGGTVVGSYGSYDLDLVGGLL
jgi:hypothetical protein